MFRPRIIITYVLFVPLFAFLFTLIYRPTFGLGLTDVPYWTLHASFCQSIIACIILLVMMLSRAIMYFVFRTHKNFSAVTHLVWSGVEVMVIGLFTSLFLSLFFHIEYLDMLPKCLLVMMLILLMPYVLLGLYFQLKITMEKAELYQAEIADLLRRRPVDMGREGRGLIKFSDDKGIVRLAVDRSKIIYLVSAGNYVDIVYDGDGRQVRFPLRNTLKGVESICSENGLERCHRSYFINLAKVKLLRRGGEGMMAEIDYPGIEPIPVSKSYLSDVMSKISNIQK